MGIRSAVSLVVLCGLIVGCAQGHCRRKQEAPQAPVAIDAPPTESKTTERTSDRVLVYKYDGSLQCGAGKAIPLDVMAKELNGIKIFSMVKKPDGLMHIQVCGSNTGMANVYEIPAKDLKRAEAKGFKKWEF